MSSRRGQAKPIESTNVPNATRATEAVAENRQPPLNVDLTNCDREPIHIPGTVQPHGAMLVCGSDDGTIIHASANTDVFLGRVYNDLIGVPLGDVIGDAAAHDLRNAAAKTGIFGASGVLLRHDLPGVDGHYNITIHDNGGRQFVEIEQALEFEDAQSALELTQTIIRRIGVETDIEKIAGTAAKLIRATVGYDRVMVYRFLHNGAGKVIAEAKRADLQSFSDQYFPASDIPVQARRLYLINWIRMIGDIDYEPVPLMPPVGECDEPVDMSFAHLRSVSKIHCEYLRNMGVAASMSISIVVDQKLWGLIACHHDIPKYVSIPLRVGAELFGQYFSMQIALAERRTEFVAATVARQRIDRLSAAFTIGEELSSTLRSRLADVVELIESDGAGLWLDGTWSAVGIVPLPEDVSALTEHVEGLADGRVWHSHELRKLLPNTSFGAAVAGALAIPIGVSKRDHLFLFRSEEAHNIEWAGEPKKVAVSDLAGERLTPRGSFETWKQEVRGQSKPWIEAEVVVAEAIRSFVRDVVLRHSEATADERTRADQRRRLLNDELNHRVKNIISLVKSIATQTGATAKSVDDYSALLEGRLRALAFAHDQSLGGSGGDLRVLLEAEASLHRDARSLDRIALDGPAIGLNDRAFGVVALLIHEMITNAAKYGALSNERGRLKITWVITSDGDCTIDWVEKDGPKVVVPKQTGFGTKLIQSTVNHDLGGEARLEYLSSGLIGSFVIPARHLKEAAPIIGLNEVEPGATLDLSGMKVMLVEDQALIAMDTEAMLRRLGARGVTVVGTTLSAISAIDRERPDCAVLDFNLSEDDATEIAADLVSRRIPFVFATGYGDSALIPERFAGVPVVRKPINPQALSEKLAAALPAGSRSIDAEVAEKR